MTKQFICNTDIYKNVHQAQFMKSISEKPTANIRLNDERMNAFPLKLGTKEKISILTALFNIVLKVLVSAIRQEKEIKCIQIGKKERKPSLSADDIIVYIGNPKNLKKNHPS